MLTKQLIEEHNIDFCSRYAEPSYDDPEKSILFANWNDIPEKLSNRLESAGFELEWSDEWIIDRDNDCCYRTSPDCWHWKPSYIVTDDGELYGIADDLNEYMDAASSTDMIQNHHIIYNVDIDNIDSDEWSLIEAVEPEYGDDVQALLSDCVSQIIDLQEKSGVCFISVDSRTINVYACD